MLVSFDQDVLINLSFALDLRGRIPGATLQWDIAARARADV